MTRKLWSLLAVVVVLAIANSSWVLAAIGRATREGRNLGVGIARTHGWQDDLLVFGAGLLLQCVVLAALVYARRRGRALGKLVETRTAELRASEESYRNQFFQNSSVMLLVDA